ncbi:MAG: large subunit ribosomal protein L19e [Candidatus Woesearchaeota archaeon]|jgi:large subunit ribosomal protein L19e
MDLKVQKRLAAAVLKCSPARVVFATDKLATIKEALTRSDIRDLINGKSIKSKQKTEISKSRVRKIKAQKRKGLQKGPGSRKGTANARLRPKVAWMIKIRTERGLIKLLKQRERITVNTYRDLYGKVKGNFFRNKRHIKLYLEEQKLFTEK